MPVNPDNTGHSSGRLWRAGGRLAGVVLLATAGLQAQEIFHPTAHEDVSEPMQLSMLMPGQTPELPSAPAPSPLASLPTTLFPDGTSHWTAKYYLKIIPKGLGSVTVSRDEKSIEVDIPNRSPVTIKPEGDHVALGIGGKTYHAQLVVTATGCTARVDANRSVDFKGSKNGMEIDPHGFGFPGHIQLTRVQD